MSSPQEYWDACLIRTWRNFGTVLDANKMFQSIVGEWPNQIKPRLLRIPSYGFPFTAQARYFVAHFLPKLNEMLHNVDKDKDVAILRKLKDSKYDILDKADLSASDQERFRKEGRKMRTDKLRTKVGITSYSTRNSATDWNVVKGPSKSRVRK